MGGVNVGNWGMCPPPPARSSRSSLTRPRDPLGGMGRKDRFVPAFLGKCGLWAKLEEFGSSWLYRETYLGDTTYIQAIDGNYQYL